MHQPADAGGQRCFGHMADAFDVDAPHGAVGIAGDGDPGGEVEYEFGPAQRGFERRRVEHIALNELHVEPVERCTEPHIDGSHLLASGDEGPNDIGPQVPRCTRHNESHGFPPGGI